MLFCHLWIFFFKLTFSKKSFRNTIRVSNSLDPDQAWCWTRPDVLSGIVLNRVKALFKTVVDNSLKYFILRPRSNWRLDLDQFDLDQVAPDQITFTLATKLIQIKLIKHQVAFTLWINWSRLIWSASSWCGSNLCSHCYCVQIAAM